MPNIAPKEAEFVYVFQKRGLSRIGSYLDPPRNPKHCKSRAELYSNIIPFGMAGSHNQMLDYMNLYDIMSSILIDNASDFFDVLMFI